ncbi:MAG: radical SAM/SPASM domain-containing protein [Patescibacteria group bacterium]
MNINKQNLNIKRFDWSWLVLNYNCNQKCKWCYTRSNRNNNFLSLKTLSGCLDLLASLGMKDCILIGGEPTLYPYLIKLIAYGSKIGLRLYLVTNGIRLHDESFLNSLKNNGIYNISLSIPSFDKKEHEKIVNKSGVFEKKIKALERLSKSNIRYNINCVIDNKKITHYQNFLERAQQLKIKTITFLSCFPVIMNGDCVKTNIPNPQTTANIIEKIYQLEPKYQNIRIVYNFNLPLCLLNKNILEKLMEDKRIYTLSLLSYGTGFSIDPQGNVLPGNHWVGCPLTTIWHNKKRQQIVSKKQFLQRWNSKKIQNFRKTLWYYPSKKCMNCAYWSKYCLGGNPLLRLAFDMEKTIEQKSKW